MNGTALHQCRQLKRKRLASACRKYGKQRIAVYRSLGSLLLKRHSVVSAKAVVSEESLQVISHVELCVAVVAAFAAACLTQQLHDKLNGRIILKHPAGSNRTMVCSIYQRQRIRQFAWILSYHHVYVCIAANHSFIYAAHKVSRSIVDSRCTYHLEKSFKLTFIFQ